MKKLIPLFVSLLIINNAYGQTLISTASTGGLKYPLLEGAVATWVGYTPDADQNILETIKPTYPRAIYAFWHGSGGSDPMVLSGDPFCTGTGYISGFPTATIDRQTFGGVVAQNRRWDTYVAIENSLAPQFDVSLTCTYNIVSKVLSVQVTGTALATLSGTWNINAYIVEDSISSGKSTSYNQSNYLNAPGSMACTGSPSWYIGAGNPITSGSLYSHMQVVEAILCPGASIWGESAFSSPTLGTTVTKTYTYTVPGTSVPKNIKVIGLVEKYDASLTTDRAVENAIETGILGGPAGSLYFTGGHTQTMSVCENSAATSINTLLAAFDSNTGTTVDWSVFVGASHGTLVATYSTTSTGGTLTPTGLSYTPAPGFYGVDNFKIIVADGGLADTTGVTVNVNPAPVAITGVTSICTGNTSTLSSTTGGTWTSTNTSVATIGLSSGSLFGVSPGTSIISYILPGGCYVTANVNVSALPTGGTITGLANVCTGASIVLSDAISSGVWTSSNTVVATINASTGIVSGLTVGTTIITYTVTYTCGTAFATKVITVGLPPVAGSITGPSSVCTGVSVTLSDAVGAGAWTAINGNATVTGSGVVHGVTVGIDTISYTVTNSCGSAATTDVITIVHCVLEANTVVHGPDAELNIYPNPAKAELTISYSAKIKNVVIVNLVGQTQLSADYDAENVTVNISTLSPGIYFIKVNGLVVRRFVKE
jgi:type IX secretion system substrate protein/outer membrane protein Omp28